MNNIKVFIVTIFIGLIATSCTDVIEVDLPKESARLVVEASIDWEKGTTGNEQQIKLSTTTPFFNQQDTSVIGADVKVIKDDDGSEYVFADQNDGTYKTMTFVPEVNKTYTLEIIYNNQKYTAIEKMMPVVAIKDVYQSFDRGIGDVLEFNVDFEDPENEQNFYYFKFKEKADVLPTQFNITDEFVNGNLISIFNERQEDEEINQMVYKPGDVVTIDLFGISEVYYNYLALLISQSETGGNPFGTTPVPLKGNCINESNRDMDALGYFRLTQTVKSTYTFL